MSAPARCAEQPATSRGPRAVGDVRRTTSDRGTSVEGALSLMSVESMLGDLADVGRSPTGGYRRFAWTDEDLTLREWFRGAAEATGLAVTEDRVGNQWAWWGDPDASLAAGRPGVVAGSHLDSVPGGGNFDGPLGVVSALRAVEGLRPGGCVPDRA